MGPKSFSSLMLRLLIIVYAIGLSHQECNTIFKSCGRGYYRGGLYVSRGGRYGGTYGNRCATTIICTNISDSDTISDESASIIPLVILQSNITKLKGETFEDVKPDNVTIINSGVKHLEPGVFQRHRDRLKTVNLAFNNISDISNSVFSNMIVLENVNVSHNNIVNISSEAFKRSPIETLDASSNRLKNISGFTRYNPELKVLSLKNNEIEKLLNGTFDNPSLKSLELQYNEIELIESGVFLSLKALTFLDLGGNKLHKMNGGTFPSQLLQSLGVLEIFGVSHNNLKTISVDSFMNLTQLWRLDLSSNFIEELLPGTFSKLNLLLELDLHRNKLKTLPNGLLQYNRYLRGLRINGNLLEEFNRNVLSHYTTSLVVYLDDNKWSCDHLSAIIHTLTLISSSVVIAEGAHHSTPNIKGNSCSLNATVRTQNVTIETFLKENLDMLRNLNENLVDEELANERIISALTQTLASQNSTSGENATLNVQVENIISTLLEIRDVLTKTKTEENSPAAYTDEQNHAKPQGNSSVLIALLCTQIIFMLFVIGAFVYYVKFRNNFYQRNESTLLESFDDHL